VDGSVAKKQTRHCAKCGAVVFQFVYDQYRGRCDRCRIANGVLDSVGVKLAIREHMEWIKRHGSLRAAIEGNATECEGPLLDYYRERARGLAALRRDKRERAAQHSVNSRAAARARKNYGKQACAEP
jgi:SAM-dependent MidA family methyltransferase